MVGICLETLAAALAKKEVVSVVPSTIQPKSKKGGHNGEKSACSTA